jgi:hypothetical protein
MREDHKLQAAVSEGLDMTRRSTPAMWESPCEMAS